jgi:flagellin
MNAHTNATMNNRNLDSSLSKLSSGLRINTAADDASGMAIADSLRSQASALGQAIGNANDAIGMIQTADKAMDEQLKILDTIKVKATQAAQDGQTAKSRQALQKDIARLIESLDNIASTTSFNGQTLLAGAFSNKEFQVGAFSNETVKASIGATNSTKIGSVHVETGDTVTAAAAVAVTINDETLETVTISTSAGTGLGELANVINKNQDILGVRATANVEHVGGAEITAGDVVSLTINGVYIGTISGVQTGDSDGRLVNAINAAKTQTGVEAFTDSEGKLHLRSLDGRGIAVSSNGAGAGITAATVETYGRLTLTRLDSRDIKFSTTGTGFSTAANIANATVNLNDVIDEFDADVASAAGAHGVTTLTSDLGTGVETLRGAMLVMDVAQSATELLDSIRADLGSVQNQLVSTINNISVTQVNVKAAESNIRDVDFAAESANFSKFNILAQSGSYAMSQANAVQQNVLRLLQ